MLFHFSEDKSITKFIPRKTTSYPDLNPVVWAIDQKRSPLYFFPRDCPRIAYWPVNMSSQEDRQNYYKQTNARMVITIENRWFEPMQNTKLYVYSFEENLFSCFDEGAGYYISRNPIKPVSLELLENLVNCLRLENVELRLTPSLEPLSKWLPKSSLHFSMIRMRNAVF